MPRVLFGVTVAMTAQAFLRDQLVVLAERGWDVHLACSAADGTDSFARLHELTGVDLHDLPMTRRPDPARDLRSLQAWMRLVGRLQPDVVVASTPKAGLLGMLAARVRNVPTRIYHVRGLRAEGLSGAAARISLAAEHVAIGSATNVLVDSPSLLAAMRRDGLLAPGQGVVLGAGSCCGVDLAHFRPPTDDERRSARAALGFDDDDIVIGFVGRLAVDKGIRELVAAAEQVHHSDDRVRLALIGPVEDDIALASTLATAKAASWAQVPGPTVDPRAAYWGFDVFCLPSHREGFPVSPLEAQACGLPVITTNATGAIDAVATNLTGLVVPVGSMTDLADAIRTLVRDPSRRIEIGSAGRARVEREFDRDEVRERVVGYIEATATT